MNRKTRGGNARQRAGSVTEAIGKLLGSSELQQAGAEQANAGKAQQARGGRSEDATPRQHRRSAKE